MYIKSSENYLIHGRGHGGITIVSSYWGSKGPVLYLVTPQPPSVSWEPGFDGVHWDPFSKKVQPHQALFLKPRRHKSTKPTGEIPEESGYSGWGPKVLSQGRSSQRPGEALPLKFLSFLQPCSLISIMLLKTNMCWPDEWHFAVMGLGSAPPGMENLFNYVPPRDGPNHSTYISFWLYPCWVSLDRK